MKYELSVGKNRRQIHDVKIDKQIVEYKVTRFVASQQEKHCALIYLDLEVDKFTRSPSKRKDNSR